MSRPFGMNDSVDIKDNTDLEVSSHKALFSKIVQKPKKIVDAYVAWDTHKKVRSLLERRDALLDNRSAVPVPLFADQFVSISDAQRDEELAVIDEQLEALGIDTSNIAKIMASDPNYERTLFTGSMHPENPAWKEALEIAAKANETPKQRLGGIASVEDFESAQAAGIDAPDDHSL